MAENKKSFTAYCDWNSTFNSLPDEKAGQLIKHLLAYVNDENPSTDDLLINAVFASIKATLKRDLVKWNKQSGKNKENALLRWDKSNASSTDASQKSNNAMQNDANACERMQVDANVCERMQVDANHADSVSVSVSVSDSIITNVENRS